MYDFTTVTDRRSTWSSKWDVAPGELPMSTADMDFRTCPEVVEALQQRLDAGLFGYTDICSEWYDAVIGWWKRRYGLTIQREWIVFSTGVVPTISSAVRKLTTPNENVVLLTPVYNIFQNSIVNNGRRILPCPLVLQDGEYSINWDDFEARLADPQTSLLIFCNPHNPVGKLWDRETLQRVGHLCARHHVTVISDEIHCDLTDPGFTYTPMIAVDDICAGNTVMCAAPTKTFSLAGLQTSVVVIPDPVLRHKVWRALNTDECGEPGAFAMDAAIAAFNRGEPWLEALRTHVAATKETIRAFIRQHIPQISVVSGPATYLLWLDCRALTDDTDTLADFIREKTGLILNPGAEYGPGGEGFLRMNTAYPDVQITDGLNRLQRAVALWQQEDRRA